MCTTRVGESQISQAKRVNLIEHLLKNRPDMIIPDRTSKNRYIHPDMDSLVIMDRGFTRFSDGDTGDQIQFLENYCNLSFVDAVKELCKSFEDGIKTVLSSKERKINGDDAKVCFNPPTASKEFYKRVWSYLVVRRNIPSEIVKELIKDNILYQDAKFSNAVFLSKDCDYAEVVGVGYKDFKKIEAGSDSDGYWIINRGGNTAETTVYVTESAIDAISLYTLLLKYRPNESFAIASMGGLKGRTLERIANAGFKEVIIAVDNDKAGEEFATKNKEFKHLKVPALNMPDGGKTKDWNDLLNVGVNEEMLKIVFM